MEKEKLVYSVYNVKEDSRDLERIVLGLVRVPESIAKKRYDLKTKIDSENYRLTRKYLMSDETNINVYLKETVDNFKDIRTELNRAPGKLEFYLISNKDNCYSIADIIDELPKSAVKISDY